MFTSRVKGCNPRACLRTCNSRNSNLLICYSMICNGLARNLPGDHTSTRQSSSGCESGGKDPWPKIEGCSSKGKFSNDNKLDSKSKVIALHKIMGRQYKYPCRRLDQSYYGDRCSNNMLQELKKQNKQSENLVEMDPNSELADLQQLYSEANKIAELCNELSLQRYGKSLFSQASDKRKDSEELECNNYWTTHKKQETFKRQCKKVALRGESGRSAKSQSKQIRQDRSVVGRLENPTDKESQGMLNSFKEKLRTALANNARILGAVPDKFGSHFRELSQKACYGENFEQEVQTELMRKICDKIVEKNDETLDSKHTGSYGLRKLAKICNEMIHEQSQRIANEEKEIKQMKEFSRKCEEIAESQGRTLATQTMEEIFAQSKQPKKFEEAYEQTRDSKELALKERSEQMTSGANPKSEALLSAASGGKPCVKGAESQAGQMQSVEGEKSDVMPPKEICEAESCRKGAAKEKCERLAKGELEQQAEMCKELAQRQISERFARKEEEMKKQAVNAKECAILIKEEKENGEKSTKDKENQVEQTKKCEETVFKEECKKLSEQREVVQENCEKSELLETSEKPGKSENSEKGEKPCKEGMEERAVGKVKDAEQKLERAEQMRICDNIAVTDECKTLAEMQRKEKKAKKECDENKDDTEAPVKDDKAKTNHKSQGDNAKKQEIAKYSQSTILGHLEKLKKQCENLARKTNASYTGEASCNAVKAEEKCLADAYKKRSANTKKECETKAEAEVEKDKKTKATQEKGEKGKENQAADKSGKEVKCEKLAKREREIKQLEKELRKSREAQSKMCRELAKAKVAKERWAELERNCRKLAQKERNQRLAMEEAARKAKEELDEKCKALAQKQCEELAKKQKKEGDAEKCKDLSQKGKSEELALKEKCEKLAEKKKGREQGGEENKNAEQYGTQNGDIGGTVKSFKEKERACENLAENQKKAQAKKCEEMAQKENCEEKTAKPGEEAKICKKMTAKEKSEKLAKKEKCTHNIKGAYPKKKEFKERCKEMANHNFQKFKKMCRKLALESKYKENWQVKKGVNVKCMSKKSNNNRRNEPNRMFSRNCMPKRKLKSRREQRELGMKMKEECERMARENDSKDD